MRVGFAGMTHLGQTMARATEMRGFDVERFDDARMAAVRDAGCALVFIARDVNGRSDETALHHFLALAIPELSADTPVVVLSQVSPGFTRPWATRHPNLYYQVDTLIMSCALDRALHPERHIVGCADPGAPLPAAYQAWLDAFPAPVLRMGYESAELAKLAVNLMLATQISAANTLAGVAGQVGAKWHDIVPALRLDARIGPKAYIEPGTIGGHLPRDVRRIQSLAPADAFAASIGPLE